MYSARNPHGSQWDGQTNNTATRPKPNPQTKLAVKTTHGCTEELDGKVDGPHPNQVETDAIESEHPDSNPAIDLTRELRPILIMMTVYGLYYPPIDASKSLPVRLLDPRRLYCIFINLIAWANALRFILPMAQNIGNLSVFLTMIAPGTWHFQCAFGISCWFYHCTFSRVRFQSFVAHLHRVYGEVPGLGITGERRWVKRAVFIAILIPVVIDCFDGFVFVFFTFGPIDEIRSAVEFLYEPFPPEGRLPMVFVYFASAFPYIFTVSLCVLFSKLMSRMFEKFNEKLQNGISEDGKLQFSFEKLRCEHQRLAK